MNSYFPLPSLAFICLPLSQFLSQQYFGKDFKGVDRVMINPQRTIDPYDENEVKGTRMPEYTKLTQERDIYGELGWIPNFNVKVSKDNNALYPTSREYFDGPRVYHRRFNTQAMTNPEFFRQNAPKKSVARVQKYARSLKSHSPNSSKGFNNSRGFNGAFVDRRNTSVTQNSTTMSGSRYDTPFLLDKDPGNKFKVIDDVERTMRN